MSNLPALDKMVSQGSVLNKLQVAGIKQEVFIGTLKAMINDSKQLQKCSDQSILLSALKAVGLNLSIDPNLAHCYIVPYGTTATFQISYRGYIQMAIRSGKYKSINSAPVYADEVEGFNPLTQEFTFKDGFRPESERFNGGSPIGYYASFELLNGFKTSVFKSKEQIVAHAKQYSQAYKYDVSSGKKSSPWSTAFDAMALKTVLKQLISKYGVVSAEMGEAMMEEKEPVQKPKEAQFETVEDQEVETASNEAPVAEVEGDDPY